MTNEEKAKRIALNKQSGKANGFLDTYLISYESAMEMAKWKDDKFFTILACIKFSLEKIGIKGADKFIEDIQKQWEE